jgi:hypothetical protein
MILSAPIFLNLYYIQHSIVCFTKVQQEHSENKLKKGSVGFKNKQQQEEYTERRLISFIISVWDEWQIMIDKIF